MGEHTPGPWRTEGADAFGDHTIDQEGGSLAIAAVVSNLRKEDEVEANARLIAAAPELLGACTQMFAAFGEEVWVGDKAQALDTLMDAINKAEGRTS